MAEGAPRLHPKGNLLSETIVKRGDVDRGDCRGEACRHAALLHAAPGARVS